MHLSLPMLQSQKSKDAWATIQRGDAKSAFPFTRFPPLLEFLDQMLPTDTHIALIGGGRGYVSSLLPPRGRTFVTLDIATMADAFVPLVVADFEKPLPDLRQPPKPLCALAAFSLEYGDITLATKHIADMLLSDEIFTFVCHNKNSPYVESMKIEVKLLEYLNACFDKLHVASVHDWLHLCRELEVQMRQLFSGKRSSGFPDFGPISECNTQTLELYRNSLGPANIPVSLALYALLLLRSGYDSPVTQRGAINFFAEALVALGPRVERAESLLAKPSLDIPDIVSSVDSQLRPMGGTIVFDAQPHRCTTFSICNVIVFEKE